MKEYKFNYEGFELNGFPWFLHNNERAIRLPLELESLVSNYVWELANQTTGGRIRFRTNSSCLGIKTDYDGIYKSLNMSIIAKYGFSLYVDNKFWCPMHPPIDSDKMDGFFYQNMPSQMREITIYMPNYSCPENLTIILDDDAAIHKARSFRKSKPIIFYGTSITQGGSASQASLSYEAMLCRDLNMDFVNLGFSESGLGEPYIAEAISSLDAELIVLDYSQNHHDAEHLSQVYKPFIEIIRSKQKTTPIVCISTYSAPGEAFREDYNFRFNPMREHIKGVVSDMIKKGDNNIVYVNGQNLIKSEEMDCFVDSIHPNDLGMRKIADRLRKTVEKYIL